MDTFSEYVASIWIVLDYPLFKMGKSSITLWGILLNILLLITFFVSTGKLKQWLLSSLSRKKGINISNWRAAITLGYYGLLGLGLVGILQTTGLDLSFFTVLTGAIGIGVGFGMQTIISNFVSGIILLLEKPLRLGDRIEIGDVSGNVHNISVRATTIITNDNVAIIVPNSDFISKQLINWSYSGQTVRVGITVSVAYNSDPELVKSLLLKVAENEPGVLKSPVSTVRLAEFGDNGLIFKLLVWTQDYADRMGALKSLINFAILKEFRANNISIPFPQMDLHILKDEDHKSDAP
jgi:small-conductance mechanosensitive channel